jgi:hypothetical protein
VIAALGRLTWRTINSWQPGSLYETLSQKSKEDAPVRATSGLSLGPHRKGGVQAGVHEWDDFRVLTMVEMGMKNHELVPSGFFFFFLVILGFELRASHLLVRCSST